MADDPRAGRGPARAAAAETLFAASAALDHAPAARGYSAGRALAAALAPVRHRPKPSFLAGEPEVGATTGAGALLALEQQTRTADVLGATLGGLRNDPAGSERPPRARAAPVPQAEARGRARA